MIDKVIHEPARFKLMTHLYVVESAGITLKTAATETGIQLREALLKTVPMPRGYIDGLIMSNAAGDTAHDIFLSVGLNQKE